MELESVKINRFRSVKDGGLNNCGRFNVLIGKNNSGKSNVLSAIDVFFRCIKDGNIATLDVPITKEIDFFDKQTQLPIEITLIFLLTSDERAKLIDDIIKDAPQMRNAVDGFSKLLKLSVTLSINPPPLVFAFVSRLKILSNDQLSPERELLSIGHKSALELRAKLVTAKKAIQDLESLRKFTGNMAEEVWTRYRSLKAEIGIGHSPMRYLSPFIEDVSSELLRTIEALLGESNSSNEFQRGVQSLIAKATDDAKTAQITDS